METGFTFTAGPMNADFGKTGDIYQTAITVNHPNGGTSEVVITLRGDVMDVDVNTSPSNPYSVGVDNITVSSRAGEEEEER